MKHRRFILLAALTACWLVTENHVQAQGFQLGTPGAPPIRRRPAVSPFINMRPGSLAGVDYYGIVRPQMDAQRAIGQLEFGMLNQNPDGSAAGMLPPDAANPLGGLQTGHPATFMNYQRFFPLAYGTSGGMGTTAPGYPGTGIGGPQTRPFFPGVLNSTLRR